MYAGKVVGKSSLVKSRAKQKLLAEIKIHRDLKHPHVVKFEHYFEDKHNVYILLELCHGQTLMELIKRRKRLTEREVRAGVCAGGVGAGGWVRWAEGQERSLGSLGGLESEGA